MSYGQNGTNGYTNGYPSQGQTNRYEGDAQEVAPAGGRRARRAGGYGGFFNNDLAEQSDNSPLSPTAPDPFSAPVIPAWRQARDESQGRDRLGQGQNTSRMYGDGPGARQIEGAHCSRWKTWSAGLALVT